MEELANLLLKQGNIVKRWAKVVAELSENENTTINQWQQAYKDVVHFSKQYDEFLEYAEEVFSFPEEFEPLTESIDDMWSQLVVGCYQKLRS